MRSTVVTGSPSTTVMSAVSSRAVRRWTNGSTVVCRRGTLISTPEAGMSPRSCSRQADPGQTLELNGIETELLGPGSGDRTPLVGGDAEKDDHLLGAVHTDMATHACRDGYTQEVMNSAPNTDRTGMGESLDGPRTPHSAAPSAGPGANLGPIL
ncbi:hypothetical protein, partial [Streptomyces alkaliphilus]|uniref:hypothetical protein n=1 Tax=Streptomyces alkaliphilus TaxID=1472722 RepID=UPI001E3CFFE2